MAISEISFYRPEPNEVVNPEKLSKLPLKPTDVVLELAPGKETRITVNRRPDGQIATSLTIACLADSSATLVTFLITQNPEEDNSVILPENAHWYPVQTYGADDLWVLIRHQLHPNRKFGQRLICP